MSDQVMDLVPVAQNGALVARNDSVFMPAMSIESAVARFEAIVQFTKRIMHEGQDFGAIPGTNKPTLLKPGAEKLCSFFGLEPEFTAVTEETDWTGEKHSGEPFFYVRYRCRLIREGRVIGSGEGSCNSWESKYRWRDGKRKCPKCGQETIIPGKAEYGGGWLCWNKKGGCGEKFSNRDPAIAQQQVGRVPNPDIADVVNTIQKMAQKRSLIAATLIGTNASEFFTQDTEDQHHEPVETVSTHNGGTRADQEAVAARKLADLRAQKEGAGEKRSSAPAEDPGPPMASATSAAGLSPGGASKKAAKTGYRNFDALKSFGEIKKLLRDQCGDDHWYYSILEAFGLKHANEFSDDTNARKIYKVMATKLNELKNESNARELLKQARGIVGEFAFFSILEEAGCKSIDDALLLPGADFEKLRAALKDAEDAPPVEDEPEPPGEWQGVRA